MDPSALLHSTVGITRHFEAADAGVVGVRGTAWFLAPTLMATAAHVATAMKLSERDWIPVEITGVEKKQVMAVRLGRVAGAQAERIAVLELRSAFSGSQDLQIRRRPLVGEERVVSLAYPENQLRFASGRFVEYGTGDKVAGGALFELFDGDDRLVLDHGASGAPVLDCEGRVVAVVSNLFTQTMHFASQAIRVSTAWGQPNVVAVPIQMLDGFAHVK